MIADSTVQNSRKPARLSQIGNINSVRKHFLLRVDTSMLDTSTLPGSMAPSDLSRSDTVANNYNLKRMNSNSTVDSAVSVHSKFKVQLQFSSREIALLRYTWNKMLVEELLETEELSLPIPGSIAYQSREKTVNLSLRLAQLALSMFCTQFYGNLLSMAPELEVAFPSLRHQAAAMASVMSLAINSLENLSVLDEYLTKLGNTHARILGIEPAQFELMGEALIITFNERFGNKFSHELEVLWIKLYMYLANSILQFGTDPVLKLSSQVYQRSGVYTESSDALDSDLHSVSSSMRSDPKSDFRSTVDTLRQDSMRSSATEQSSVFSAKPEVKSKGSIFKGSNMHAPTPPLPQPLPPKPKKSKKRKECVIV